MGVGLREALLAAAIAGLAVLAIMLIRTLRKTEIERDELRDRLSACEQALGRERGRVDVLADELHRRKTSPPPPRLPAKSGPRHADATQILDMSLVP